MHFFLTPAPKFVLKISEACVNANTQDRHGEQIQVAAMYMMTYAMDQSHVQHAIPSEAEPRRAVLRKRKFDSHWSE